MATQGAMAVPQPPVPLDDISHFIQEYQDADSFDAKFDQCLFAIQFDREHSAHDANSFGTAETADTPGLLTQTTDTGSSNSSSPSIEPSEGHQVTFLNLLETKQLDDNFTYPQVPDDNLPRIPHLNLPAMIGSSGAGGPSSDGNRPPVRRDNGNSSRPRRLQDPEETAQVRGNGACIRCRLAKTKVCTVVLRRNSEIFREAESDFVVFRAWKMCRVLQAVQDARHSHVHPQFPLRPGPIK
jgi:hypothetical protein